MDHSSSKPCTVVRIGLLCHSASCGPGSRHPVNPRQSQKKAATFSTVSPKAEVTRRRAVHLAYPGSAVFDVDSVTDIRWQIASNYTAPAGIVLALDDTVDGLRDYINYSGGADSVMGRSFEVFEISIADSLHLFDTGPTSRTHRRRDAGAHEARTDDPIRRTTLVTGARHQSVPGLAADPAGI